MYVIYRFIAKIISPVFARVFTANQVTVLRVIMFALPAACFLCYPGKYLFTLAGVAIFGVFGLFDYVDGEVARMRCEQSPFGKELDSFMDKVGSRLVLFGFVIGAFRQTPDIKIWAAGFLSLLGIALTEYIIKGLGREEEITKTTPRRAIINLFILPDYLIIWGAVSNQRYIFLIIMAVVANARWALILADGLRRRSK